jgi:hypothetical protein
VFASLFALQLLLPESLQRLPVDPLVVKGKTQFQILQKNFDRARDVSLREVTTDLPGRCFFLDSPTTPIASLLAVSHDGAAQGPAFESDDYRRITPLISRAVNPSRFDRLPHNLKRETAEAVKKFAMANAYPVSSNGSLIIEGLRTVEHQRRDYALRRFKNWVLLRLTCAEVSYCLNSRDGTLTNRVLANAEESPAVCYYWKPTDKK